MMDEIERDIEVLSHGWLAAVCAIAFLAAAFIFASWAVSCHAGELIPLDGVWAIDPDRPSHFIASKTDKGTVVYDCIKGTFSVEPGDTDTNLTAADAHLAVLSDITTTGSVEGLAEAASTGVVLTIPEDGQVLMHDGTTIEWVINEGAGDLSSVPPQGTTKKGGIMGFYFPIVKLHWFLFWALGLAFCAYLGILATAAWVNDRKMEWPNYFEETPFSVAVIIFILASVVLAVVWPVLYPGLAVWGALYATRSVIRLKKSVSQKSELGHTHDE